MASVRVLVCCANGLIGREVVRGLLTAGFQVRALVRNSSAATYLVRLGADVAAGDLGDPASLRQACMDSDVVFFQVPSGLDAETTERWGFEGLETLGEMGIKRLIYHPSTTAPRAAAELPAFEIRQRLEQRVRAGSWRWAIIRPTAFMLQNLLLPYVALPIQLQGSIVYPVGSDVRLSWVAAEDVGHVAANILAKGLSASEIDLGSSKQMNGADLAEAFAEGLGRPIRFVSLPLDEFEHGVDETLGVGVGKRVSMIFRFIEAHPDDRDFVSRPYQPVSGFDDFHPMPVSEWVRLHREAFSTPVTTSANE